MSDDLSRVRAYWRLHIPTGQRTECQTDDELSPEEFYWQLDQWNRSAPGLYQYWSKV